MIKKVERYRNPWHQGADKVNAYGPPLYTTDVKSKEYKGHLIYERIKGMCWDVVKDGVCVTQRAGLSGAKKAIDNLVNGGTWNER
jgi:hypothetical protein